MDAKTTKPSLCQYQIEILRLAHADSGYGSIVDAMKLNHGLREKTVDMWIASAIRLLDAKTLPEAAEIAMERGYL